MKEFTEGRRKHFIRITFKFDTCKEVLTRINEFYKLYAPKLTGCMVWKESDYENRNVRTFRMEELINNIDNIEEDDIEIEFGTLRDSPFTFFVSLTSNLCCIYLDTRNDMCDEYRKTIYKLFN